MINNIRSTLIEQVALTDPLYWILGSTSIIVIFFCFIAFGFIHNNFVQESILNDVIIAFVG